jgi:hypothetical protein
MPHEELQSKYKAAFSLAAEAESFLQHSSDHPYSLSFIQGHFSYLQQQGSDLTKEVDEASVEDRDVASLVRLRASCHTLTALLDSLSKSSSASGAALLSGPLASVRQRLAEETPR